MGKSFKDLFNEWKAHYHKVSNESLPKYIEWSVNRIENYPYTFFVNEKGNPKVHTITPQDFEDYFVYRKNNSVKKGISYSPSKNTHYYDRCSLRRLREVITLKNFQSKNHLR